ncbi:hypothetical protein PLESTB_000703600 [Pleodorina starrii]|uniref:Methyltransferase domain-containing protein n=1 Tax=Pleodorina starrii TaxID=330485 RepID=A0A9W6BJQ7_9CHLO|nr:hypothetical protein PLESTB_000703600 [Pleodorina starrii]GLC74994.1 hypothetical protein PLESTF_001581600 [Pleodorina starrii]
MTSPTPLVCAGLCGGGCGGNGPIGSSLAALPRCTTSAGGAAPGCVSHPSPRDITCLGYVGQGARPAGEYHECDFDWHEHARAVRHLVEAQEAQALALRLAAQRSVPEPPEDADCSSGLQGGEDGAQPAHEQALGPQRHSEQQQQQQEGAVGSSNAGAIEFGGRCGHDSPSGTATAEATTAGAAAAPPLPVDQRSVARQPQHTTSKPRSRSTSRSGSRSLPSGSVGATHGSVAPEAPRASGADGVYEGGRWEEFYRAHPSARFFKERRYLLLEFPELLSATHVAEIGCGCGSSILPVLKANPAARTTCTDISTTCLAQLRDAAATEGIALSRLSVFPADATDAAAAPAFDGIDADALLIMFTLSAVTPERQAVMLSHAWRALAPGGRLLLRDHGLYDMVQLRIPADQWVGPNLYKRGDGTMAYFFSTEELISRARGAGFETVECKYVTVVNRNRKTGVELRRVFVHGVFQKPLDA